MLSTLVGLLVASCFRINDGQITTTPTAPLHLNALVPFGHDGWVFSIAIKANMQLCLDIKGGKGNNGDVIDIWECNGHESQLWFFDSGTYNIKWAGNYKKCIDAGNMQAGSQLKIWDCNGMSQQKWNFDGTIYQTTGKGVLCMDLAGGKINQGTVAQLWGCNHQAQQVWSITPGITIRAQQDYHVCLDLSGGILDNGTPIGLWACNGMQNQKWNIEGGTWQIRYAADTRKCVDAGNLKAGGSLQLWDCLGTPNQKWGFDGTFFLPDTASSDIMCMDLHSDLKGVQIWNCNHCWNQYLTAYGPASATSRGLQVREMSTAQSSRRHMLESNLTSCPPKPGPSPGPSPPAPSPPGPNPPGPSPPAPPPSSGGKAGVAMHLEHSSQADRNAIAGSHISWHYNWGTSGPTQNGLEYFPQIWGSSSVKSCSSLQKSWAVLGFNEPNMGSDKGGSAMSVDQVVQLWPQVEKCAADRGVQTLVGPAVANVHPSGWYDDFFGKCKNCRVDAIAIHSYSCDVGGMKNYVNTFKKYGKPLWLTEFACADNPKAIPGNSAGSKAWNWECSYMKGVIPYLMAEAAVAKFSWFSISSSYTGESNLVSGGKLTQLGDCYNNLIGGGLTSNSTSETIDSLLI